MSLSMPQTSVNWFEAVSGLRSQTLEKNEASFHHSMETVFSYVKQKK